MNAGRLDRDLKIYTITKTQSSSTGGYSTSRTLYHECWGQELAYGGDEKQEQYRNVATNRKKFRIRYFEGIKPSMELLFDGDYYDITEVQHMGRDGVIIKCETKDDR